VWVPVASLRQGRAAGPAVRAVRSWGNLGAMLAAAAMREDYNQGRLDGTCARPTGRDQASVKWVVCPAIQSGCCSPGKSSIEPVRGPAIRHFHPSVRRILGIERGVGHGTLVTSCGGSHSEPSSIQACAPTESPIPGSAGAWQSKVQYCESSVSVVGLRNRAAATCALPPLTSCCGVSLPWRVLCALQRL
jgi:hypothetical protein